MSQGKSDRITHAGDHRVDSGEVRLTVGASVDAGTIQVSAVAHAHLGGERRG